VRVCILRTHQRESCVAFWYVRRVHAKFVLNVYIASCARFYTVHAPARVVCGRFVRACACQSCLERLHSSMCACVHSAHTPATHDSCWHKSCAAGVSGQAHAGYVLNVNIASCACVHSAHTPAQIVCGRCGREGACQSCFECLRSGMCVCVCVCVCMLRTHQRGSCGRCVSATACWI
jgi:hypothetical protein